LALCTSFLAGTALIIPSFHFPSSFDQQEMETHLALIVSIMDIKDALAYVNVVDCSLVVAAIFKEMAFDSSIMTGCGMVYFED